MRHDDKLICYYADQRMNETYGQKMVHQTTTDLRNWGPVVDDVTSSVYTERPGMPTVARLPNGKFIMAYEHGGHPVLTPYQFPLFYKLSSDPEDFHSATGVPLRNTDGYIPTGSPYVVWSPVGGSENGTIIASAHSSSDVYINTGLGEPGTPWTRVETPEKNAYTRHLRVLNDPTKLLILGAGQLPPSTTNKVQLSVIDIGGEEDDCNGKGKGKGKGKGCGSCEA
jgi:hypothetical protein